MGEKYTARMNLNGVANAPTRCRDNMMTMPDLMMEVHENDDGSVIAFAIPPPGPGVDLFDEASGSMTTLQEAGHEVLTKRNEALLAENRALVHLNKKLEEQNRELMDRLMRYADKALEVLHGEKPAASSGGRSTQKKPRASKSTEGSNGAAAES